MARTLHDTQDDLNAHAASVSTPEQAATLAKCLAVGWRVTRTVGYRGKDQLVAVALKGTAAFILPCGKLDRAPVGNKTARAVLPR